MARASQPLKVNRILYSLRFLSSLRELLPIVFERAGPIIDPMYHNSGDLSDRAGYDFVQVRSIAKVTVSEMSWSGTPFCDANDVGDHIIVWKRPRCRWIQRSRVRVV